MKTFLCGNTYVTELHGLLFTASDRNATRSAAIQYLSTQWEKAA